MYIYIYIYMYVYIYIGGGKQGVERHKHAHAPTHTHANKHCALRWISVILRHTSDRVVRMSVCVRVCDREREEGGSQEKDVGQVWWIVGICILFSADVGKYCPSRSTPFRSLLLLYPTTLTTVPSSFCIENAYTLRKNNHSEYESKRRTMHSFGECVFANRLTT